MLTFQTWSALPLDARQQILSRPFQDRTAATQVRTIIEAVQAQGDTACKQFTKQFDGANLSDLRVSKNQITNTTIDGKSLSAIETAIQTIATYHQAMMPESITVNTAKGVQIERIYRPINKVGLYIPGGNNAPLISSLLMQAIPALVAGCPIRILCTPPNSQGEIDAGVLVAARLCQIETIYPIG